ncbi:MAG TPA: methyltransferase domain-containing protein [Nocardioidaceae bacterium]|nr:methyltransferase domain-containing protein [Nocardioidaceae bacterium]
MARLSDRESLRREWEDFSAEWIARSDSGADGDREGVLDDWMLEVVGDVTDLDVIDLGCGEGRFCRMLAVKGARARRRSASGLHRPRAAQRRFGGEHRIGDFQQLTGVPDAGFDLAVSYISLVDVPDQAAAVRERSGSWCREGGSWCATCRQWRPPDDRRTPWHRRDDGTKLQFVLDHYASEGARRAVFPSGHELTNIHRMLSTTINDFLDAGFVLTRVHEPLPTPAQLARVPESDDLFRVPIFIIYDLAKPTS